MPTVRAPSDVEVWAASGAMALSGRRDGSPLGPPARLVDGIAAIGARISDASGAIGERVDLDWLALLGERAALAGLSRGGTTSVGGSARLVRTLDGWIALSLARRSDIDLVPAWLEREIDGVDPWPAITHAVADRAGAELVERAALLGLPVGAAGEWPASRAAVVASRVAPDEPVTALDQVVVLDLSSLWAGPLCASLLGLAGAIVVKVESTARPDGARQASDGLFDVLNAGKQSVALDLATRPGRDRLAGLIQAADVVVESARPRALEQMGVIAADVLRWTDGPRVWVSITGHGRASPRVAFGDDAAVAGGLVVSDADGPCFCADAVADPTTGLEATAAALDALAQGGRWLLDVALAGVASQLAGPTLPAHGAIAAPPRARPIATTAPPLGADTAAVLERLD